MTIILAISILGICHQLGIGFIKGYIAVGVFFASYKFAGFYYDLGRVDNLALGLIGLGSWLTFRHKNNHLYGLFIGIILALAFLTKQHSILAAIFLLSYLGFRKEIKTLVGLLFTLTILIVSFFLISYLNTGFWTFFYTVIIPSSSPIETNRLLTFFRDLFLPTYWPMLVIIITGLLVFLLHEDKAHKFDRFFVLVCVISPLTILGIGTYIKIWGYINGMGGVAAAVGLSAAFGIDEITKSVHKLKMKHVWEIVSFGSVLLLLCIQLWILKYNPQKQIPDPQAIVDGYQLIEKIKKLPTPIYTPAASYLLDMAGLQTNYHISQYSDIQLGAKYNPIVKAVHEKYDNQVFGRLNSGYYQSVILPNGEDYDIFFAPSKGFYCQLFPHTLLESMDGAHTSLKGICSKITRTSP